MQMQCPCGAALEAPDEDALVDAAQAHLEAQHPGRSYTREQILFFVDPWPGSHRSMNHPCRRRRTPDQSRPGRDSKELST